MTIRVLLVEDNAAIRGALQVVLARSGDIVLIGEAVNAAMAIEQAGLLSPEVIVLDVHLPDSSGMEVAERVRRSGSAVKIVALSAYSDRRFVSAMLRAGATGYVAKSRAGAELVDAIRAVAAGERYFCAEVAPLFASPQPAARLDLARRQS